MEKRGDVGKLGLGFIFETSGGLYGGKALMPDEKRAAGLGEDLSGYS